MQGNLWVRICQHMCKRTCDSFTACLEFIKSDKRSKSGKAGQWDSGIHFGTSRLTRSVDTCVYCIALCTVSCMCTSDINQ